MSRRSLFFKIPDNINNFRYNLSSNIRLPVWYNPQQFLNDLFSMFFNYHPKTSKFPRIPFIFKEIRNVFQQLQSTYGYKFSPKEFGAFSRFFLEFPKTQLFQMLIQYTSSPQQATRRFLELLESIIEVEDIQASDGDVSVILRLILSKAVSGLPIPFINVRDTSNDAGASHSTLQRITPEMYMLMKAYQKVKPIFKWTAEVSIRREESIIPEDDVDVSSIRQYSDVIHLMPLFQHSLPEELYVLKLATKSLTRREFIRYKFKPKKIVVLVDVSGSMEDNNKYIVANASLLSICDLVKKSGVNELIVVPFDSAPHEPITGSPSQIKQRVLKELLYSGGGTNIDRALQEAEKLGATHIILITDGKDYVHHKPKVPLYTVAINCENEDLKKISREYYEVRTWNIF